MFVYLTVNFEPSLENNNKPGIFQQSVKSRANEQNQNIRQRELKSLNVSNALIAHYPSTPASKNFYNMSFFCNNNVEH